MLILVIVIFVIFILLFVFSLFLYRVALNNKQINFSPKGAGDYESITTHSNEDILWLNASSKNIYIKSFDDLKLHGYLIDNNKDNYAILVHGYRGNGNDMIKSAKKFGEDFNILIPDLRGHGKSDGKYIGMGYHDSFDIASWVKYINKLNKNAKIILFGISMGAATVLLSSDINMKNVKLIIADSSYISIFDEYKYQFKNLFHLPIFPFLYIVDFINCFKNKYTFEMGNVIKHVGNSKLPILFIHGISDTYIPCESSKILYENKNGDKEILFVDDAQHVASEVMDSKLYWKTIHNFIKKHL